MYGTLLAEKLTNAIQNVKIYSGSMWPSVVVHEHWPVSQRMIVEMGDYAWSEHIVTVCLACQVTIKNAHRARIVQYFLQQEAVQTIPWPAMSPDMNPIEHIWDFIGRKFNQRNPKCQNIDELRTAIFVERAHCHGMFGLSGYHQERTSPTYSQRKNNPRQLHPHLQKHLGVVTVPPRTA
jgi:hypothetical protein